MSPKPSAYLETIIGLLLPYFLTAAADIHDARSEVIDTLAAYGTRTRAELLQAARIIAFGMSTLDVLADARSTDLSPSMRVRYRGCANGLNRGALATEKALEKCLACEVPAKPGPQPEPADDQPDLAARGAAQQAPVVGNRHHGSILGASPRPSAREDRNRQLWAGAMIDTLQQMGMPVQRSPGE